jgi:hypothetical protein
MRLRPSSLMHHASCIMHHASCIMHHASCIMHHASCIVQVRGGKQRALGQGKAEEALAVFDWFERKLLHAWTEVSISQVRLRALTSVDLGAGTAIDCERVRLPLA